MPDLRIGISGWTYAPWRGVFFPKKLTQKRELEYASRTFNSIEVNGTFYSMQRPGAFAKWMSETPDGFVFAIKGGRYISHLRRLKDPEQPLANFFAQGILTLGEKLGPILWQTPPNFQFDAERVETFFKALPKDTKSAAKLASQHDDFMKKRAAYDVKENVPLRYAMEIRHETFRDAKFIRLLRKYNVALCVADTAGRWPYMEDVTADFVYCRLHGDEELYSSGYTDAALDLWASRIRAWSEGRDAPNAKLAGPAAKKLKSRDVFVYFDNDVKVHAPFDSANLANRLGIREEPLKATADLSEIDEKLRESWPPVTPGSTRRRSAKARSMLASKKRVVPR